MTRQFTILIGATLAILLSSAALHAQKAAGVLETMDSEWPGIQTDLLEVKRMSDNTIRVRWRWRNTTDKEVALGNVRGLLARESYLLDPMNKKKHLAVTDSEGKLIGSQLGDMSGDMWLKPREAFPVWVKFPAPPPDVKKITVVIGKTTPFEDIALQ